MEINKLKIGDVREYPGLVLFLDVFFQNFQIIGHFYMGTSRRSTISKKYEKIRFLGHAIFGVKFQYS